MTKNVRTLGKAGSDLLTEITRQGKRIFTYEDAVKIYGSSNRRLRELSSTLARMHKAGGLRFLTDWQAIWLGRVIRILLDETLPKRIPRGFLSSPINRVCDAVFVSLKLL
jgi:hypothetical protein